MIQSFWENADSHAADEDTTIDTLNPQAPATPEARKRQAARWSMASNALLIVLKLSVAGLTGSVSVFAEAVHSCGDLIGAIISYISVRLSDAPPDESHAYGHGKFENLSGVAIALMIFGAGAFTAWEAVQHLHVGGPPRQYGPALGVMGLSFFVNLFVSSRLLQVGRETDLATLTADGRHLQTDVFTSLCVFASLGAARLTGWVWLDPVTALAVSLLIFWIGFKLAGEAVATLSDASLPLEEEQALRCALTSDPRVLGYHYLRTRKSGSHRYVDVHVQISDTHSFVQAHDLTEELEDKLRDTLPNVHPIIHMEPYEAEVAHHQVAHYPDGKRAP